MKKTVLKPLVRQNPKKEDSGNRKGVIGYLKKYITLKRLIKCVSAFLLSGTSLIAGSSPLGYAFFVSCFGGGEGYVLGAFSLAGIAIFAHSIETVGKYITAMILFSLIYERFVRQDMKNSRIKAVAGAISLFLSGILMLFITMTVGGYPLIYDVIVLSVETALVWAASMAFSTSVPLVFSLGVRRTLSTEETISLALLAGGIICGIGRFEIGGVFSVTGTLCVLSVLIFAFRFGSLHGCAAGIVMGIINCLSRGRIDACAASFTLSGLCAGYFSKKGKWAACISFVMTNAVVTVLSNGSTEVLINISDTILAAAILYCLPKKVFESIGSMGSLAFPEAEFASAAVTEAENALECCKKSFLKLNKIQDAGEANRMILYKRTAHRVCSGCGLRKYCWGRDKNATHEAMDKLLNMIHNEEQLQAENSPPHCLRAEQFIEGFSYMYEIYKADCIWTARIAELQNGMYNGFGGVAELIRNTARKISDSPGCDTVSADDIKYRLRREGISVKSVIVSGKGEESEVTVMLENCGGFGRCENAVRKVISASTGQAFVKTGIRNCGECRCHYVVKPEFSVSSAVASAIKTNRKVSGDYVLYALINRDTYAIILCDGMGSGEAAREESRACASMLMRLLESGMDGGEAIKLVNSMLLCSSAGSLAAIDLCLISLSDATSKIFKCGGAGTFLKTEGSVMHISVPTLPAGAVTGGDTKEYSIDSKKGSMIVLVSDGAISDEVPDPWIKNVISDYDGASPEQLAKLILDRAKRASFSEIKDDITVVASFIG